MTTRAEHDETEVHELRHRLRNAFAVSSAITLASAREMPEHQAFAAALAQRFSALSLVQARLLDAPRDNTLPRLAAELIHAFVGNPDAVRLAGLPEVPLGEQHSRLVALVLAELCVSSLRHGALSESGPRVDLSGTYVGGRLTLAWRERGAVNPAEYAETPGARLMARMARAYGGAFRCEDDGGGFAALLELTVPA